jgi:hypothetical protein
MLIGMLLVSILAFGACSQEDRLPYDGSTGTIGREASVESPFADQGAARPACQFDEDGGPCGCLELSLLSDAPNIYFVLDRSGSMGGGKWETMRTVLSRVVTRLGPRIRFGATVFPGFSSNDGCGSGSEVMPLMPGDSPAGTAGPAVKRFLSGTNVSVLGGTPTAATLRELLPKLSGLPERTFVILATDGGPNCNSQATCSAADCIFNIEGADNCPPGGPPNCCSPEFHAAESCLDRDPTREAVAAFHAANIPVYVVGVPGSGPYAELLDSLAEAGGTARPSGTKYYRIDGTDPAAFQTALSQVAAKITADCTFALNPAPPDPKRVNVYFDDVVVAPGDTEGWKFDGDKVTLLGQSCASVLAGEVLNVRVISGCPTAPIR